MHDALQPESGKGIAALQNGVTWSAQDGGGGDVGVASTLLIETLPGNGATLSARGRAAPKRLSTTRASPTAT
jgi:hypothetical protein